MHLHIFGGDWVGRHVESLGLRFQATGLVNDSLSNFFYLNWILVKFVCPMMVNLWDLIIHWVMTTTSMFCWGHFLVFFSYCFRHLRWWNVHWALRRRLLPFWCISAALEKLFWSLYCSFGPNIPETWQISGRTGSEKSHFLELESWEFAYSAASRSLLLT